jgi:2-polyprenyl-3-methyl-5-hydroxy-6-metoxy-1,4-benzoquinol methylase
MAAYHYALDLASGLRVLDAGCGEGFGTQALADVAEWVVGLDYSREAVETCRRRWKKPNLRFDQADLREPGAPDQEFDLVLSLQVIEHMRDEIAFLDSLKARIGPGGKLLLTTPNRLKSFSENPYHVREYASWELRDLLEGVYSKVTLRGIHGNQQVIQFDRNRKKAVKRILRLDPLNLRKRLPSWAVNFAFARLSILVRRRARAGTRGDHFGPDAFYVSDENLDAALDLIAICEP